MINLKSHYLTKSRNHTESLLTRPLVICEFFPRWDSVPSSDTASPISISSTSLVKAWDHDKSILTSEHGRIIYSKTVYGWIVKKARHSRGWWTELRNLCLPFVIAVKPWPYYFPFLNLSFIICWVENKKLILWNKTVLSSSSAST